MISGSGYPTGGVGPFFVAIDLGTALEEKILCSSRSANVFTIASRGADDTLSVDHASGATVQHVDTAIETDEANAHVNAGTGVHGRTSQLASISDVETLTNKSISGSANTLTNLPASALTGLGANWAAALAAALDTDTATVLAAMHNSWPTVLNTALGANWATALAASLDTDAVTVLNAMGTGWPAALGDVLAAGWQDAFNSSLGSGWATLLDTTANVQKKVLYVQKPANEAVISSTAFQDDDDLQLAVVANTTYHVHSMILFSASTVADFKMQWLGPAGATLEAEGYSTQDNTARAFGLGVDATYPAFGGNPSLIYMKGKLVVAGTAGTFKMQFAQVTSEATNTTVWKNSELLLTPVT